MTLMSAVIIFRFPDRHKSDQHHDRKCNAEDVAQRVAGHFHEISFSKTNGLIHDDTPK